MEFVEFIRKNRSRLVDEWFEWMIQHYPEPSRKYLLKREEAFTNPVGYNIFKNIEKLLQFIGNGEHLSSDFENSIGEIIKIRSIQGLESWFALNIFDFLWQRYAENLDGKTEARDLLESIGYYHRLVSICVRKYVEIKEMIAEIQKNEMKNRYGKILERLNEKYLLIKDRNDDEL
ncbi:MAG: RsbRD N-terminal domain-containing protein [Candidatus Kapaibacteriota bacterium]